MIEKHSVWTFLSVSEPKTSLY